VASYLFATFAGGGNSIVLLRLANRLAQRGHEVALLGSEGLAPDAEAIGISRFVPFSSIQVDLRDRDTDPVRDWEPSTQLAGMLRAMKWMLKDALPISHDVRNAVRAIKPDVVVADAMLLGAIAAAEASRLPSAAVMHGPWFVPTKGSVPFGLGTSPKRGLMSAPLVLGSRLLFDVFRPTVNRMRRELALAPLLHTVDQFLVLERTLVLTSQAFDVAPDPLPRGVVYVGPERDRSEQTFEVPKGVGPLVLVGFSTTYQAHEETIQRTIDALGDVGTRAVVTTGPVNPERFKCPPGVLVIRRAPHSPIMKSADAVITHAGHGTVMEALGAGVPLLCIPISRDQPDVAARVVYRGAGIALSRHATSNEIGSALRRILHDEQFRRAAQALALAIRQEEAADGALLELETLAEARR
jgi:MGT family glycosyltransferase